ncbi:MULTISPECIES: fibronectin type III domain-containing protein [unclassified Chryseobacterium]|uniref:fibronectin type III domain-containing protein n=1 Tax=unclassified Chryseobacterium TaxID=2593645 RepID=UPI000F45066C|nr:fibronectin type III domain-containing protein [Chryseobacterium sp. G0240]ROI01131.1 T9SS C-terminal target domain-containing protein [Chryseobacterium sp. G0240]
MKKLFTSLILFLCLINIGFVSKVYSQTGQIGTGTGTSTYLPIYTYYGYNYSQQIYTAAEVSAAIGTSTYITAIKFYSTTVVPTQSNYNNWVVYMGNTTQNNFASNTSWVPLSSLTTVFSGTIPTLTSGGWVTIQLATPFVWNGTDNLVIAVNEKVLGYSDYPGTTWGTYSAGQNRGILYYEDTTNPNPAAPPTAKGRYSDIPRLQLETTAPPTCMFPTSVTTSAITANSAQVNWVAPTPAPANGYDVYYNTTGVAPNASTVLNATNSVQTSATTATIPGLNPVTTYYVWVRAKCSSSDQSLWIPATPFTTLCSAITALPWTENFDSLTTIGSGIVPNCWAQITGTYAWGSANTGSTTYNAPRSAPNYMRIQYGNTNASQLWTPDFALTAGTTYEFSFYYNTGGTTSSYVGYTGNVLVNNSQTATGATTLGTFITSTQGTTGYTLYKVYYTPTTSGNYNFGLSVASTSSPWYLGVDDFKLRVAPTCLDAQGLSILNVTTSSATIQWTVPSPAPAGGYDVYYTTANTIPAPTAVPQYNGVTGPTQLISGLTPSTTYYIWVRARCSGTDIGDWTGPLKVYTNYCVPTGGSSSTSYYLKEVKTTGGFTNLAYTASSYNAYVNNSATTFSVLPGNSLNFSMTASGTSSYYYYVWIDWNNDMVFDPATETVYASTSYASTATGPISSVGHPSGSYRARFATSYSGTISPCGSAPYGNYVDFTFVIKPCSTTAPTNVYVDTVNHNTATVHWTASPDNLNYKVYWREVGTTGWPNSSAVLSPPTNSYVITTGLQPVTNYETMVVALCNTTEGTAVPVSFTTRCDPTPPNVTISNITTSSALITWSPLAASSNYFMRWRKVGSTGAGSWNNVNLPAPPANTYVLGSVVPLEPYTTYEVQIANQCIGESTLNPYSNPKVFTTERTCELPPPGLTITQLFPTMAEVKWDPFPGATYILRYRKVGIPSWTEVPSITNTLVLNGLTELTKYEMQVVNICNGTPGAYTPPYYFTTPTVVYCSMGSANSGSEHIAKVTVKPNGKPVMENASDASTYTDYTGVPETFIELIQGSTDNEIIIEKKWNGTSYNEGIAVWIDFNRNGEFDINERVFTSPPNTTSPVSGKFDVPADAFVSMTDYKYVVMRVAMQRDGIPVSCVDFGNGEVEDYTVRISKKTAPNPMNQTEILIYPNPVSTVLYVKNISPKAKYKIYNAAGQVVADGILLNNQINVSRLINGVYVIDIDDNDRTAQKKFIKE